MKINVKNTSANRMIALNICAMNHGKQLAVIRGVNLYIISKSQVKQGDISITSILSINWV